MSRWARITWHCVVARQAARRFRVWVIAYRPFHGGPPQMICNRTEDSRRMSEGTCCMRIAASTAAARVDSICHMQVAVKDFGSDISHRCHGAVQIHGINSCEHGYLWASGSSARIHPAVAQMTPASCWSQRRMHRAGRQLKHLRWWIALPSQKDNFAAAKPCL